MNLTAPVVIAVLEVEAGVMAIIDVGVDAPNKRVLDAEICAEFEMQPPKQEVMV